MPTSALTLAALPLSRHAVDRDHQARSRPALFDELWTERSTHILALWGDRSLVRIDSAGLPHLVLQPVDRVPWALVRVYLGRTVVDGPMIPRGSAIVVHSLTDSAARELEPDESQWVSLKAIAHKLSDLDAGLFTEALGIVNWHFSHPHCPGCGSPTVVEQGGWVRRCLEDQREIFPRIDPAVIISVLDDDDRLLLGSNASWERNRYSLLAGFVEPGESFEAAAVREVAEEAAIIISEIHYRGSQPWPFPASLMIGMTARLADGQTPNSIHPDGEEILDLRWFSREELWGERDRILVPGVSSIARGLIEDWYGGSLDKEPAAL